MLIVGNGPVARSLAALGETMGYHVRVAAGPMSPRIGEFDRADEVIVTPLAKDVEALRPGATTYVVICGDDETFCEEVLRCFMRTHVPYLGMMTPTRSGQLVDRIRSEGFTEAQVARVHCPAGVSINSQDPEEIAVSILAEIVKVRRS